MIATIKGIRVMWHYLDKLRQSVGPFSREEIVKRIASGTIGRNTLVWNQGMADWSPLGKITELAAWREMPGRMSL